MSVFESAEPYDLRFTAQTSSLGVPMNQRPQGWGFYPIFTAVPNARSLCTACRVRALSRLEYGFAPHLVGVQIYRRASFQSGP
jgi:hypothetical protein